jgi:hypothetical protein
MRSKAKTANLGGRIAERLPLHVPSEAQRRYLQRGLAQAGGKLPLFDEIGQEIPRRTIEICIEHGWAEPWIKNRPDWPICRLTAAGYRVLGEEPPANFGRLAD